MGGVAATKIEYSDVIKQGQSQVRRGLDGLVPPALESCITLTINKELLEEAKTLSGAKTKKEAIEIALKIWERITKMPYRIKYRHLTRAYSCVMLDFNLLHSGNGATETSKSKVTPFLKVLIY